MLRGTFSLNIGFMMRGRDLSKILQFNGVDLVREGRRILSDISFAISPGERWVVLGPNGAGKSSLFSIASAQMRPTSGIVQIFGQTLGSCDMRKLRRRIGICSDQIRTQIRNDLSAHEVVLTGRYGDLAPWWNTYTAKDSKRAAALLDLAGVGQLSSHLFGTLSAGESQQILIARALMMDPELLFLDEPTSGLDLGARERFLSRLAVILNQHRTLPLLMITHHVEDIPASTTHALLLKRGAIVAAGEVDKVLTDFNLSTVFDYPLVLEKNGDRYRAGYAGSADSF